MHRYFKFLGHRSTAVEPDANYSLLSIVPETSRKAGTISPCIHCINRNEPCQFSPIRRKFIRKDTESSSPSVDSAVLRESDLPIDRILRSEPQKIDLVDEAAIVKASDERTTSSNISFFSARRMSSLANQLGSTVLTELVHDLEDLLITQVCASKESPSPIQFKAPLEKVELDPTQAETYINAYFENVHPIYPFLEKEHFTSHTAECQRTGVSDCSDACLATYHAVLALGSQYHGGGSFSPGSGVAWELFQTSLGLVPGMMVPPYSLADLQALIVMAIFSMTPCCLQLEQTLVHEAARVAHSLQYHKSSNTTFAHLRAFWIVYYLEKIFSFSENRSSIFADEDIGCDLPFVLESDVENYRWFLSAIQLARLTSMTYTALFTTASSVRPEADRLACVQDIRGRLEDWRSSLPTELRPMERHRPTYPEAPMDRMIIVQTHYAYYQLVFAIERVTLHIDAGKRVQSETSKWRLLSAARNVIDLLQLIDVQPHTPLFIFSVMPLSALFVVFDFVIHNPNHKETNRNLTLLDQAAGFFGQIDYASESMLPGNIISRFAMIARQYILNKQGKGPVPVSAPGSAPDMQQGIQPIWDYAPNIDFAGIDIDFASLNTSTGPNHLQGHLDSGERIPVATTPFVEDEGLNYPIWQDMQIPNNQITELKSIFGFVFPDTGGFS